MTRLTRKIEELLDEFEESKDVDILRAVVDLLEDFIDRFDRR